MNPEPHSGVGFHPIQKIPKRDFLDGALVGAGSLKPPKLTSWLTGKVEKSNIFDKIVFLLPICSLNVGLYTPFKRLGVFYYHKSTWALWILPIVNAYLFLLLINSQMCPNIIFLMEPL
jgi:hypothetical protein